MAKNDRDRLIQTFMARNRNRRLPGLRTTTPNVTKGSFRPQKGKAGGLNGYRPIPTGGENAVFSRSRTDPPRRNYGTTGAIPGFGDVRDSRNARKVADARARNDTTTRPRYGSQRAPYRKGERFKRENPYKYERGDAARAHRPRYD